MSDGPDLGNRSYRRAGGGRSPLSRPRDFSHGGPTKLADRVIESRCQKRPLPYKELGEGFGVWNVSFPLSGSLQFGKLGEISGRRGPNGFQNRSRERDQGIEQCGADEIAQD